MTKKGLKMQDVHYKGRWWLPNEPDKILNGEFSFTRDDGGKLELYGSWEEILKEEAERILGITQDGKKVTLSNCLKIKYSPGGGFSSSVFNVNQAYIGCHFNEEVTFRKVYINFKDIQVTSQEKIKKWFEKADILEPVFSLYFAVIHNPPSFTDERFLFLIQALEVYHRRIGEGKELPEQEHQERIQKILETVPQQYKDWLEGKLEYSNELSLRKRLKEIYDEFSYILNSFKKRKGFINLTVETRNYLTHYDEKLKERCARGIDLLYLSFQLELILYLCLLKELGFTGDEIENSFKRYMSYRKERFERLDTLLSP